MPGDGYVYFRGTDDTLWQVKIDDPAVKLNPGAYKCASGPFVTSARRRVFPGDGRHAFCGRRRVGLNFPPSDWMKTLMSRALEPGDERTPFKDRSLKQIVIPGSHDAAMYVFTGVKSLDLSGYTENAKTQNQSVYDQLCGGVRFFDLRPTVHKNVPILSSEAIYLYHGTAVTMYGPKLADVISDVKAFMGRPGCQEVVILKFSHYLLFTDDAYDELTTQLGELADWKYTNTSGKRLAEVPLKDLVSDNKGKVLIVCDGDYPINKPKPGIYVYRDGSTACDKETRVTDPRQGDLRIYDCYSDSTSYEFMKTNQLEKFQKYTGKCDGQYTALDCDLFLLSWTLTPPWTQTVWDLAEETNTNLAGVCRGIAAENGKNQMINVIYVDYYETSGVTEICYHRNGGK